MYIKQITDSYITSVGMGDISGVEITAEEYSNILSIVKNRPDGYYRLKTDLTWEEYTPEVVETDDEEVTDEEFAAAIKEALA